MVKLLKYPQMMNLAPQINENHTLTALTIPKAWLSTKMKNAVVYYLVAVTIARP